MSIVVLSEPASDHSESSTVRVSEPAGDHDDQLCDVISAADFSQRITDILINSVPAITGGQIVEVRNRLLNQARRHGWVED